MHRYAIIAAAGSGSRMGKEIPKQFLEIDGKTLLQYTLEAFEQAYDDIRFIIVLPEAYIKKQKQFYAESSRVTVAEGGATRFQSVLNGLNTMTGEDSIVFVHDAARCLVTAELIRRCGEAAEAEGSAIPVADMHDSLRFVDETGSRVLNRNQVKAVQTPQTFQLKLLKQAFEQAYRPEFTDEATVMEYAGHTLNFVPGETTNIKVTTPFDLLLAGQVLKTR